MGNGILSPYFVKVTTFRSVKIAENLMARLTHLLKILFALPQSIIFNFRYLPFNQAIKLPILIYGARIVNTKGRIYLATPNIQFGMIRFGGYQVSIFSTPKNFIWDDQGGVCEFQGECRLGNGSAISIGPSGRLIFGDNFVATANCKIVAYTKVEFGSNVLVGWDGLFLDTDFHALTTVSDGSLRSATAPIKIGSNNWFALKCTVLKGTTTPDFCTVGANSVLNKNYAVAEYSVLAGQPAELKGSGIYRDAKNDRVQYDFVDVSKDIVKPLV